MTAYNLLWHLLTAFFFTIFDSFNSLTIHDFWQLLTVFYSFWQLMVAYDSFRLPPSLSSSQELCSACPFSNTPYKRYWHLFHTRLKKQKFWSLPILVCILMGVGISYSILFTWLILPIIVFFLLLVIIINKSMIKILDQMLS